MLVLAKTECQFPIYLSKFAVKRVLHALDVHHKVTEMILEEIKKENYRDLHTLSHSAKIGISTFFQIL